MSWKPHARGVRKAPGTMNKLESAYNARLETRMAAGEIAWFKYEAFKLRLADNTFYSPDFAVMLADGTMEIHETKGHWEDDARVKIKVAATLFPFRFFAITQGRKEKKGQWIFEEF